jgi:hypothetical protein
MVLSNNWKCCHWQKLEQNKKVKPSIIGYLRYLKEKRDEAQHPDKRFDQEDSERIFLHIKELLKELKSP